MQNSSRWLRRFALVLLVVFSAGRCQQTDSRRAVTEHQLMHDRGKNIQSLKRLIWLSSAIEGLHTAETRSAALGPNPVLNLSLKPALAPGSPQPPRGQSLLRDFFQSYREP
ncbi:uncharacterized protein V6R79_022994 [Siganus canaliculatus]